MTTNLKPYYRSILASAIIILGWQVVGPQPTQLLGTVGLANGTLNSFDQNLESINDAKSGKKTGNPMIPTNIVDNKYKPTSEQYCQDSDGGRNPSVQGQTCTRTQCAIDLCRDPHTLVENFCQNGNLASETITCNAADTCVNGQCLERPNILLIIADDADYELHGFMGHPTIETENLDELRQKGVLLPHGVSTMSRCRPPLASIISGQWPHENGIYDNYSTAIPKLSTVNAMPEILRVAGYNTYIGGKFWEGDPADYGFTHIDSIQTTGGPNAFVRSSQQVFLEFLEQSAQNNKPFFVWYAPSLPHLPHNPPSEYLDQVDDGQIVIPDGIGTEELPDFLNKSRAFYATTQWLDDKIGEVFSVLESTGLDQKTIIIYAIDNGYSYGYVSKGSASEKGLRTPIVIYDPRRPQGDQLSTQLISTADLGPTILDYAGLPKPQTYSGESLKPLIDGIQTELNRSSITQGVYRGLFALVGDLEQKNAPDSAYAIVSYSLPYKYIRYTQDISEENNPGLVYEFVPFPSKVAGEEELFNLLDDPNESNNLIHDPAQQTIAQEFRERALDFEEKEFLPNRSKSMLAKPTCVYHKEYSNPNECACNGTTPHWTVYRASNGISCSTQKKTIYVCRDTKLDLKNQISVIPREVVVHLAKGATQKDIYQLANQVNAFVRKEPCDWNEQFNGLQTVMLETGPDKEKLVVRHFSESPIVAQAYQMPQVVCVH